MAANKKRTSDRDKYIGVTRTSDGRFGAVLRHAGTIHYAGVWATREDAALARDRAILRFGIEQERGLNLPKRARKLGAATPEALRREARLAHMKARGKSCPYFGVTWTGKKWAARVNVGERVHHVTNFDDAREAAIAYDRIALFYLGSEAVLNFPGEATPASVQDVRRQAQAATKAGRTSQYRGVYWDVSRELWGARLNHAGLAHSLGRFEKEEDAARAYDFAAWAALGREAILNFSAPPQEPPAPVRKRGTPRPKVSKYQGVSFHRGSFVAQLIVNGTTHHLGRWPEEREAAIAHDRAVLHFGREKDLNLPKTSERLGPLSPRLLQNHARLRQRKVSGKTPYIGVSNVPGHSRWKATVAGAGGRAIFVGGFDDPELAAVAYDRVVLHLYGDDVVRNFPQRKLQPATAEAMREYARRLFKEQTTSQYRGVTETKSGRWSSNIMGHHVKHRLGTFDVEEEAAEAYDKAAKRLHRKKAKVNFGDP